MNYTIFCIINFIILFSIFLYLIDCKNQNGGSLENTLQYYDIKKYFKCDYVEGKDILNKIRNISLTDCLNKCINDISCTCIHYNPLNKNCFYKKKTLDITLDDKSLIADKDYTSYIKKNNIRNLSKNYIFLTFVEDAPISINDNFRIINIMNTELKLNKIIHDDANYSFFIKNPSTNDVVGNILSIKPNILYPLGYINLNTYLEEMSPYNISFNSIVTNEYYKVSTYHVYNPITINFYNANEKRIDIGSSYKFNIYLLNNVISDNVTISTDTDTTNIFSKSKYFIAHHNFNPVLSKTNFKNKIFHKDTYNVHAIWDFYLKKNKENFHNFCNKKYSFSDNSITNKDCFINKIWKVNYNNYNATYDFTSIDKNLNKKVLEIKEGTDTIFKKFNLNINNIKRVDAKTKAKIYFKISKIINPDTKLKHYLYLNKNESDPILLDRFCYHYIKFNNIEINNPKSDVYNLQKINYNITDKSLYSNSQDTIADERKIDDFNTCIQSCDSPYNTTECIYLNFMVNKPEEVNSKYNKHAYIKSNVDNLYNTTCNYYTRNPIYTPENDYKEYTSIPNNRSIHLKKEKYNCNEVNNKSIQTLVFKPRDYYDSDKNNIILWNIEVKNPKYKKYVNKKYSLNKIEPPQFKSNIYWSNLKKNVGEIGLGLSCNNYKELDLDIKNIEKNPTKLDELINQCSTNNCNYTILKEKCNNDPLCSNFQISKDQKECYISHLNNIYLLEKDKNPNPNKRMTTYYKNV